MHEISFQARSGNIPEHLIDRQVLRFEGMLVHLADKAVGLLADGEPSSLPLYSNDDFAAQRGYGTEWAQQADFAAFMAKDDEAMGKVMKAAATAS